MTGRSPRAGDRPGPPHDPFRVGAYLLGSLAPDERAEFETHLAGCPPCRAELADLSALPDLLGTLEPSDLDTVPAPGQELFERVTAAIDADRRQARRGRRTRSLLAGAAAAAVVGGTAAGLAWSRSGPAGDTLTASAGGMHMVVQLAAENSGTGIDVTVRGLPNDVRCRLVAVARSGARDVAGSWTAGYTGSAHVSGLQTSFRPAEISRLVLQVSGTDRRLVARH